MISMRRSSLVKEASTLLSGQVGAQVITLLAYLLLTRIYTPDDYGLFNIFFSPVELLIIISTCKLELAVVAAPSDEEAASLSRFTLRLNTFVSLGLLAVVTLLCLTDALPGSFSALGWLALIIPPLVFFSGTSRVYSALFNRIRQYKPIALSEMVNSITGSLFKIVLGLLGLHNAGMPLGAWLGQTAANVNYRIKIRKQKLFQQRSASFDIRNYRNYPLFVASKDFVNTFSSNLPFLMVALPAVALQMPSANHSIGLFALALTFTFRPANILNGAFERVLFARSAELQRAKQPLMPLVKRFLLGINMVALPACVAAWFLAEPLFTLFFGSRWEGCGVYVRALLPWIYLILSSSPLMYLSNLFSTQRIELRFYLVLLLLRAVALAAGLHFSGFVLAIQLYALVSAAVALALLVWYLMQVRRYDSALCK